MSLVGLTSGREATTETIPMEEVEPVVQVKPEVEKVEEKKVEELKVGSPGTCCGEGLSNMEQQKCLLINKRCHPN